VQYIKIPESSAEHGIMFRDKIGLLSSKIDAFRTGGKEEDLHDARVSSRKLETLLKSFGYLSPDEYYKIYLANTKELIKLFGAARELDVCAEITNEYIKIIKIKSHFTVRFMENLKSEIASKRQRIMKSPLLPEFISGADKMIEYFSQSNSMMTGRASLSLKSQFRLILLKQYDRITDYTSRLIAGNSSRELLHSVRIKSKPLRYNMEFAAEYCGMSIRSQHALVKEFVERAGKIHDVDVMIQKLIKFSKKISGTHLPDSARSLKSFLSYLNEMRKSEYNKLIDVIKKIEPARFREKFITEMQK